MMKSMCVILVIALIGTVQISPGILNWHSLPHYKPGDVIITNLSSRHGSAASTHKVSIMMIIGFNIHTKVHKGP